MLNIITSMSPIGLANDMLDKVKQCWVNPFDAPTIIFTDSKTEQWFKLHVLNGRQNVVMNLRTARLESFLFRMLKTADNQAILSPDMLRDVIMQKLLSMDNGKRYLDKFKGQDNIENYLYIGENGDEINYKHLFDFADDLSKLFIEYEITRDDMDALLAGDWQKDLYNDIITGDGISLNNMEYYTCIELANKNKKENGGKIEFDLDNRPVFVFGFSGLGQKYRDLLKEYGKNADIYVYLQVAKTDIRGDVPQIPPAEENDNIFLKHWARFGNVNHKLFRLGAMATEYNVDAKYNDGTTLGKIQNAIAQDYNVDSADLKDDGSITITSVPSKIKELEIVHSEICKLLKDRGATLKDILVLAPNIDEYKSEIATVFNQVEEQDPENKENYPFIPSSIVDFSGQNSSVLDALQTLYAVLKNGGLTRKSFFAFTKNFIIQSKYGITDDDMADVFQKWIEDMRVYRVHQDNNVDDWENAVNRLLVAKLTNKPVFFDKSVTIEPIMPFSDFDTEDDDLVTKFVHVFYDIKQRWVQEFKDKTILDSVDIKKLKSFLDDLLLCDNSRDVRLFKETVVYEKISQKLDQYQEVGLPISMEYLMLSLIDIASNVRFNTGTVFTRGVTFTSLLANRILPAKYVFIIGMSSDNFPGTNRKISLDRRLQQEGDDSILDKDKNAFLCQMMATSDELHISFVDTDLQTDNTFYPSYILDVLQQYTDIKTKKEKVDETRNWGELYTPRERRNRQMYIDLNSQCKQDAQKETLPPSKKDLPDTVRIRQFRYFLENPLKCYADRVFGFETDDTSGQELEDIALNALSESELKKAVIKPFLQDNKKLKRKDYKDLLPNEPFAKQEFERVVKDLTICRDVFTKYNNDYFGENKVKIDPNYQINLPLECDGKKYVLRGEILMCAHTDTDIVVYSDKIPSKTTSADTSKQAAQKNYPELYALVAQIADPGKEYTVKIVYIINERDKDGKATKVEQHIPESDMVKMTKQDAEKKLNEFYKRAFIQEDKRFIPLFDSDIGKILSFEDLKANFMDEYKHHYISLQALINPDTNLGFTEADFETEFPKALEEHKALLNPKD